MVETNVTELLSLRSLISRLTNEPIEYPTAKKFGVILSLLMTYEQEISRYKAEEQSPELTELLNQGVQLDITFSEEELSNIKMTPLEAYIMNRFVK